MPISGTDYLELYVGNAWQAAHYYKSAFGFRSLAYAGLKTGIPDHESYVVEQGKIRLILTSPLYGDSTIGQHIDRHGDGVKVIALTVEDATSAYEAAMARGATSQIAPFSVQDEGGEVVRSGIKTYGDTVHIFVERKNYRGVFLPGYEEWNTPLFAPDSVGLQYVDHLVGNVAMGEMDTWVEFYEKVMGFTQIVSFDDKDISTEYTALMSKVMSNGNGRIKFPINEPAAAGAYAALKSFGRENDVLIVAVDGGCPGVQNVKDGVIGATSQQYPLLMASKGVEAIAAWAKDGTKPALTPGKDFFDTGVALVTDEPADGVESIDTAEGTNLCWG